MLKLSIVAFAFTSLVLSIPAFAADDEPSSAMVMGVTSIRRCAAADELRGGRPNDIFIRVVKHCATEMETVVQMMVLENGGDEHVYRQMIGAEVRKMVDEDVHGR